MLKAGIIGCGRPGRGQAKSHIPAYKGPQAQIAALSDIALENAQAFQSEHGTGQETLYTDYREMLEKEKLDIVSICTWPHLHAPMVRDCALAGVRAIHCEKPVAPNFGDARRMVELCEQKGVQLTFNHQRRFNEPFIKAKAMIKNGDIGELRRFEGQCDNLFDWGTHWFDMSFFFNDETPVRWVLGQMQWTDSRTVFGAPIETMGLSHFLFENDVHGLLVTGKDSNNWGARNRIFGTEGTIELGVRDKALGLHGPRQQPGGPHLRILAKNGWQEIPTSEGLDGSDAVKNGILDLIDALHTGREPQLSARRALRATELIFATYESSRRRCRVDLPLEIDDSPLQSMLDEAGIVPNNLISANTHAFEESA